MKNFDVITQELPISFDKVFPYVADPAKLPEWAVAFREADDKSAVIEIAGNRMNIGLITSTCAETGRVDWTMQLPDGSSIYVFTRLIDLKNGKTLYDFVYVLPEAPTEEEMAAAVEHQTAEVHKEFANLIRVLA